MMTLREARLRRLWSIRELAKRSGVATATIVAIEAGRHSPRLVTMRKLAGALGVDPSEIAEFAAAIEAEIAGKDAA